jgi:hypothetical protein
MQAACQIKPSPAMLPGGGTIKRGSNHIIPERLVNSYLKKINNQL